MVIRFCVTFYNLVTYPVLPKESNCTFDKSQNTLLSILIPARNEEKNIENLLQNLIELSDLETIYFEIIVLNDHSTDNTAQIVTRFSAQNSKIKLVNGSSLPKGWLGKNWACHQLAEIGKGNFYIFLDADVQLSTGAISSSIARMHTYNLDLLSLFPQQKMHSFGEQQIVPLMHYLLLNLLPLRLVRTSPLPPLSAANGQFMLFKASIYRQYLFHKKVKNNVLDDVNIMRFAKESKLKTEVLLGNNQVFCRMYTSGYEAFNGFSKNLFLGFGKNAIGFQLYFLLIFWLWLPFWLWVDWRLSVLSFILIAVQNIFISILANQNSFRNLIFHPFQMILYTFIGLNSMYIHLTNRVEWKGRKV